jgi:hypothetical protein
LVDDISVPFASLQVYNAAFGNDLAIGETYDPAREIAIMLGNP